MLNGLLGSPFWRRQGVHAPALIVVAVVAAAAVAWVALSDHRDAKSPALEVSSQSKRSPNQFKPSETQWAMLTIETVERQVFRAEHSTEGKIAVNEDRATPVFPPYSGRVTRLLAQPGDTVQRGQPLFFIEAADMVQAQNDFIAAVAGLNRARAQLDLAQIIEKQNRGLYETRAVSLRELQQAQAELTAAQNNQRAADIALEAARNRLRILGRTDQEIALFQQSGTISPETPIQAPISGTVVQRKIGPGQYVSYTSTGATDPVYLIGDLSSVWLVAYIRESAAQLVRIGQQLDFSVLAHANQIFKANIAYVAAVLDGNSRRLMVRATVDNSRGLFKPEMFASVTIYTDEGDASPAVPRDAVIFEGTTARVWVVRDDRTIELRQITTGVAKNQSIQVLDGLKAGERVVTKGGLFVERAAAAS